MERPKNIGAQFKIRVNGIRVTGYYNEQTQQVSTYKKGAWFQWTATNRDAARDKLRSFYQPTDIRIMREKRIQK